MATNAALLLETTQPNSSPRSVSELHHICIKKWANYRRSRNYFEFQLCYSVSKRGRLK